MMANASPSGCLRQPDRHGTYNTGNPSITISIPVLCNDGRKGIVVAARDYGGMSGGGHFTLSDRTTGDLLFGEAAGKL
jgi:hypothetical protein